MRSVGQCVCWPRQVVSDHITYVDYVTVLALQGGRVVLPSVGSDVHAQMRAGRVLVGPLVHGIVTLSAATIYFYYDL